MKNNNTEEVMNSLHGMERATAGPYLYSKIMNRIQENQRLPMKVAWNLVIILMLVAALNYFTLTSFSNNKVERNAKASVIAGDYNISLPGAY
jgi:hypothetical protein